MAFSTNKRTDASNYNDFDSTGTASRSFFGKSMKIEGEITSDDDVTIEGNINGTVKVSKTVTIGNDGYVNGTISASVVRIAGEAEGHVNATEKVEISSQGKYNGSIKSDVIVVAEGAKLKGTINYEENAGAPEKSPAEPAKVEAEAKVEPKPEESTKEDEKTKVIDVKTEEVPGKKTEEESETKPQDN